jgi:signal transduction histidine kinase
MQMIRKLTIKLVLTVMGVLTLVLAAIFLTINLIMFKTSDSQVKSLLYRLAKAEGHYSPPGGKTRPSQSDIQGPDNATNFLPNLTDTTTQDMNSNSRLQPPDVSSPRNPSDTQGSSRFFTFQKFDDIRNYFAVKIDENGNLIEIVSEFSVPYSEDEIKNLVQKVSALKKETGTYEGMYYQAETRSYGQIMIFLDQRMEENARFRLMQISLLVYLVSMIAAFFLSWLLSTWAIKPVQTAFIKQKQFVGDASHELKTPIAVIGANIDVLAGEIGPNRWLDYIRTENQRMSTLVKDLLYLAKYDNHEENLHFSEFDLSQAVYSAALPFESMVFEADKQYELDITPDIRYTGDENRIKQAIIILIDNAIKNAAEQGIIRVSLSTTGNRKTISVYNTGEGIADTEREKIFERFYRSDNSRSRDTGGYGLGLAIAKTIMETHHGKILVTSEKGSFAEFSLVL